MRIVCLAQPHVKHFVVVYLIWPYARSNKNIKSEHYFFLTHLKFLDPILPLKIVLLASKSCLEILTNVAAVSSNSLCCWCWLYENTQAVVCDPATYTVRGRPFALNEEEQKFLAKLVEDKPTIYLAEIQQKLLEKCDVSVSLQTTSNKIHLRLNRLCQKATDHLQHSA